MADSSAFGVVIAICKLAIQNFLAVPVKYGETGIMTFQIGPEGIVYERDLGPDTAKTVASIQQYDPDDTWAPVEQTLI